MSCHDQENDRSQISKRQNIGTISKTKFSANFSITLDVYHTLHTHVKHTNTAISTNQQSLNKCNLKFSKINIKANAQFSPPKEQKNSIFLNTSDQEHGSRLPQVSYSNMVTDS